MMLSDERLQTLLAEELNIRGVNGTPIKYFEAATSAMRRALAESTEAAPPGINRELLAALKECSEELERISIDEDDVIGVIGRANDAIANAERSEAPLTTGNAFDFLEAVAEYMEDMYGEDAAHRLQSCFARGTGGIDWTEATQAIRTTEALVSRSEPPTPPPATEEGRSKHPDCWLCQRGGFATEGVHRFEGEDGVIELACPIEYVSPPPSTDPLDKPVSFRDLLWINAEWLRSNCSHEQAIQRAAERRASS